MIGKAKIEDIKMLMFVNDPANVLIGQIHIIVPVKIAMIFPVFWKWRNIQLLIPKWSMLAKKPEKGTQVDPAATVEKSPNVQKTAKAEINVIP